jgi:hypothetical protein
MNRRTFMLGAAAGGVVLPLQAAELELGGRKGAIRRRVWVVNPKLIRQ